jgi:hypothetical protein
MASDSTLEQLSVAQFAERFRGEMFPLTRSVSYFPVSLPLTEDDIREHLEDPIASLPPALAERLPKIYILLVPYLERANGRESRNGKSAIRVSVTPPSEARALSHAIVKLHGGDTVLAFAIKDQETADYHYHFYTALADLLAETWPEEEQEQYYRELREELSAGVHGEVDEPSWHAKQGLLRRQVNVRRPSKAFREYARKSFVDTLTLYMHGICCDIDLEPGPRQLPSRFIRRRLLLLESLYPPPKGYAVFPEELKQD